MEILAAKRRQQAALDRFAVAASRPLRYGLDCEFACSGEVVGW
jgi:hypothetical protein